MFARLTKLIQAVKVQALVPEVGERVWVLRPSTGRYFVGYAVRTSWAHATGPQLVVSDGVRPEVTVRLADVRWSRRPPTPGEWFTYAPETEADGSLRKPRPPMP